VFEAKQTVARVEKLGDLFAPVLELKQRLPDLKAFAASASAEMEEPVSIAAQAEDEEEPKKSRRRVVKKTAAPATRKVRRKV
jgi:hypothetical protein